MRVMLFQGRQKGVVYNLPGEHPMAEIGELIGGEPDEEMARLDGRLALVVRADREGLPGQYMAHPFGWPARVIAGDCVVVRFAVQDRRLGDINAKDAVAAQDYVRPLEVSL